MPKGERKEEENPIPSFLLYKKKVFFSCLEEETSCFSSFFKKGMEVDREGWRRLNWAREHCRLVRDEISFDVWGKKTYQPASFSQDDTKEVMLGTEKRPKIKHFLFFFSPTIPQRPARNKKKSGGKKSLFFSPLFSPVLASKL